MCGKESVGRKGRCKGALLTWLDRPDIKCKIVALALMALLVYGTAAVLTWPSIEDYEANTDIDLYRSRT